MSSNNSTTPSIAELQNILITVGDILTIIGSVFVITNVIILSFKKTLDRHRHILLMLTSVGFCFRASTLVLNNLDWQNDIVICRLQGLLITFSNNATWFWTSAMTLNICATILTAHLTRSKKHNSRRALYEYLAYHGVCWGVPVTMTIALALLTFLQYDDIISDVGGWCWINRKYGIARMVLFYGWAVASWLFNAVVLVIILIVFQRTKVVRQAVARRVSLRVLIYIVVFLVCWTPGTINRVLETIDQDFDSPILQLLHTAGSRSVTFWIGLVFAINGEIFQKYAAIFRKFGCCSRTRHNKRRTSSQRASRDSTPLVDCYSEPDITTISSTHAIKANDASEQHQQQQQQSTTVATPQLTADTVQITVVNREQKHSTQRSTAASFTVSHSRTPYTTSGSSHGTRRSSVIGYSMGSDNSSDGLGSLRVSLRDHDHLQQSSEELLELEDEFVTNNDAPLTRKLAMQTRLLAETVGQIVDEFAAADTKNEFLNTDEAE